MAFSWIPVDSTVGYEKFRSIWNQKGRDLEQAVNAKQRKTVVDIRDYGAQGNGLTDDTTAVAKAAREIGNFGGATLLVPNGDWVFDPPSIPANTAIHGQGAGRTRITAATTSGKWSASDVSNIALRGFTFTGKSGSGASTTGNAILIRAVNSDVENVEVTGCEFKNFKSDSVVRAGGNGDLLTAATVNVKNLRIVGNKVSDYYDIDPTNIGQVCVGIYLFGGAKDAWIEKNLVDGTSGKGGILVQTEAQRIHIERNHVNNCGLTNDSDGSYGIAAYSSYINAAVEEVSICRNKINYTARAGIYTAAVRHYHIDGNTLVEPDQGSTGIGTVGAGGIMVNNSSDDDRNGPGTVNGNTIIDPGFAALYFNIYEFQRAEVSATGNVCKMLTPTTSRTGAIVHGHGLDLTSNTFRGFNRGVFIYNVAADDCGDLTISQNQIDGTGVAGSPSGITVNSASFHVGPLGIESNRLKALTTGVDVRPVSDLVLAKNQFTTVTTAVIAQGLERGRIEGNTGDAGTTGLNLALKAATATARATVSGNLFRGYTTPCVVTENTGQIIIGQGNDFGTQPGVSADQGDASVASALNQPAFETFKWSTTFTANRSATQAATKCFRGDKRRFIRDAATPGAFTFAVIDGASSTTLYTIPANTKGWVDIVFDGTNWKLAGAGTFT